MERKVEQDHFEVQLHSQKHHWEMLTIASISEGELISELLLEVGTWTI